MSAPFPSVALAVLSLAACSKINPPPIDPSQPAIPEMREIRVVRWGPQQTTCGKPANPDMSGDTGLFFEMSETVAAQPAAVLFDGMPLGAVVVADDLITAILPKILFERPRMHVITVRVGKQEILAGEFTVIAGKYGCHVKR